MANFKTERYTIDLEAGFEKAKEHMEKEIEKLIPQGHRRRPPAHYQQTPSITWAITFKHILLPIWLAYYRYRNDSYQILVNTLARAKWRATGPGAG